MWRGVDGAAASGGPAGNVECPGAGGVGGGRAALGVPWYRLARSHAMRGRPVADATQWEQIERGGDGGEQVWASLERLAAQGARSDQDDTPVRMLACLAAPPERQAHAEALGVARARERPGMSPPALVVTGGERPICLSSAGRAQAGAPLAARWKKRPAGRARPRGMAAALSSHAADDAPLLRGPCVAPGRRQCRALEAVLPHACQGGDGCPPAGG